jgi:hypothetical protein
MCGCSGWRKDAVNSEPVECGSGMNWLGSDWDGCMAKPMEHARIEHVSWSLYGLLEPVCEGIVFIQNIGK